MDMRENEYEASVSTIDSKTDRLATVSSPHLITKLRISGNIIFIWQAGQKPKKHGNDRLSLHKKAKNSGFSSGFSSDWDSINRREGGIIIFFFSGYPTVDETEQSERARRADYIERKRDRFEYPPLDGVAYKFTVSSFIVPCVLNVLSPSPYCSSLVCLSRYTTSM